MASIQGKRIRQLRYAKGLTQAELADATGGLVTKQSISKYERGKSQPSSVVLTKLAQALGVKTADLFGAPPAEIEFPGYRKTYSLGKRKQRQLENQIRFQLEKRIKLQDLIGQLRDVRIPVQEFLVEDLEQTEQYAQQLRSEWDLGTNPIGDVVSVLEDHHVHVIEKDVDEAFDGISAWAHDEESTLAAAVVTRTGIPGERQRLNLTHELAHLVLQVSEDVDEENAAFRWGAAFLAPAEVIFHEVGRRRQSISPSELFLLKKEFGLSIQALVYRLTDLEVISSHYAQQWWKHINTMDWRQSEPNPLPPERPKWLRRQVLRAYSEDLLSKEEAESFLGKTIDADKERPMTLTKRKSFMELPLEERQKILARQAEEMVSYYEDEEDREQWQGGDIVDC